MQQNRTSEVKLAVASVAQSPKVANHSLRVTNTRTSFLKFLVWRRGTEIYTVLA